MHLKRSDDIRRLGMGLALFKWGNAELEEQTTSKEEKRQKKKEGVW